jgi:hypothetical protein
MPRKTRMFCRALMVMTLLVIQSFSDLSGFGSTRAGAAFAAETYPTSRNKWLWPFAQNSIWNMPIGRNAVYTPANIQKAPLGSGDQEYFYKTKTSDPLRKIYAPGSWTKRCEGTAPSYAPDLRIPDNLILKDATLNPYETPNNAAAFLMPDGQTLVQLEPLARCSFGGDVYGYHYSEDLSITGPGSGGSHFGSGLSALGGSIRRKELTGNQPIRHALKVLLWGNKYLYYSKTIPGYRWPATMADYGAANQYHGTNPKLVMGSLLAIPPNQTEKNLQLQTPAAKKLFKALQDYGAYVVDDAGWDAHYFAIENGVFEEFHNAYGYDFGNTQGSFYEDFMKLFQALQIVDNNGPNSIGGGGTLRAPLAPPFSK